jgi:hypothetical protein
MSSPGTIGSQSTGHLASRPGQGILRNLTPGHRSASAAAPDAWSPCACVTSTCASRSPASAAATPSRKRPSPVPASMSVGTRPRSSQAQLPSPVIGPGLWAWIAIGSMG